MPQFQGERDQERARRLISALLSNLDGWIEDLIALERDCCPGAKSGILHLQANMSQARRALVRMVQD